MQTQGQKKYNPQDHPIEVTVGKPSKFLVESRPVSEGQPIKLKRKYLAASGDPSTK